MKLLFGSLALLMCVSAQATSSTQQLEDASAALNGPNCVDVLEASVQAVTTFSGSAQRVVLSNLDYYQTIVGQVVDNFSQKQSNTALYKKINSMLDAHANHTYMGIPVGKAVVRCIRPRLNFTGSVAQQKMQAKAALSKIASIRKAAL